MKRRTVIAGFGTTLLTSGCLSPTRPSDSSTDDSDRGTPSDSPDSEQRSPDNSLTEQFPNSLQSIDCASFRESDVTVCAHTDNEPVPISLQPESHTFRVVQGNNTIETLDLTLSNASSHSFGFNPYDWRIDRHTGDGWTKVAPEEVVEPWRELSPESQYDYELTPQHHPSPANGPHQIAVNLTTSVYAVSVVGNWTQDGDTTHVECIALVDVTVESEDSSPTTTTTADS